MIYRHVFALGHGVMDLHTIEIDMDKKSLTERDICTKFITPAIEKAGIHKIPTSQEHPVSMLFAKEVEKL